MQVSTYGALLGSRVRPDQVHGTPRSRDADAAAEITARIAYDHEWRVTHRRVAIEGLPDKDVFYSYDLAGKVTAMVYPFETDTSSWRTRMTYDDDDPVASGPNYAQGRLAKVEENTDADATADVTHLYAYDHLGNVRVKQVEIDGLAGDKTLEYVHDLAGRVTRLIYPNGAQARYAYDSAGRLSRVWDAHGKTLAAYTHTAAGNIDAHVVGHGVGDVAGDGIVKGAYTYNARDWVTDMNYAGKFKSTLTYDPAGNVTRQVYRHGSAASITADYDYDDLYRITDFDVSGGASQDYAYDRNGNITSLVTGTSTLTYNYTSSSTPNRLDSTSGTGGMAFSYNPNGWMTARGTDTVGYDSRGLTTGYGSTRYLVDPDRRRVKKTVGTAVTYYLRGADGTVLAEYDRNQTLSARYVYAGSRRIARIAGSSASYYLTDHLGSTRALVDESGAVTATYDYRPYGAPQAARNQRISGSPGTSGTRSPALTTCLSGRTLTI